MFDFRSGHFLEAEKSIISMNLSTTIRQTAVFKLIQHSNNRVISDC